MWSWYVTSQRSKKTASQSKTRLLACWFFRTLYSCVESRPTQLIDKRYWVQVLLCCFLLAFIFTTVYTVIVENFLESLIFVYLSFVTVTSHVRFCCTLDAFQIMIAHGSSLQSVDGRSAPVTFTLQAKHPWDKHYQTKTQHVHFITPHAY